MIVDCAIYRGGRRQSDAPDLRHALATCRADEHAFLWIGLHEPSLEEFEKVAAELGLHPLAVEDSVNAHQRPKLELYDDSLFLVLKTIRYVEEESAVETGEVMVFVGDSFVVTVRHGEGSALSDVRHRLESDETVLSHGPSAVLYAVCDRIVDDYTDVSGEVEQDIEQVEERVFSPERTNDAVTIYRLKREVIEFRHAVLPLREPMERLATGQVERIPQKARPFFRDVADHVARVGDAVESFDDLLTSVLNANLAQVSVRQNDDMRRISAWVAMAAVPTLVAGIYGMNFEHMPELGWRLGYPMALALMAAVCTGLYRAFKRSGWL